MKYKSVRGMEDILPKDVNSWQNLEKTARNILESFGYKEIRTPILEDTSIFVRSIGEATDIVTKEMYTFKDRKGRSLTMRPEGTAPIVRSYVEHSLQSASPETKLYYIGPMFRSERPQKGRTRQFHQIGVEVIGTSSPFADVEVISQLDRMLKAFGLENFKIKLNSLGCKKDKVAFTGKLKKDLEKKKSRLCDDCKVRIKKNALRVLDCKNESCIQVVREAPNVLDSLCKPCKESFDKVKKGLRELGVSFAEAKNLVRGLDYYTGTVFEITHSALGAQDAIGAGGRYDNLVKDFGGPEAGAVGYALGIERMVLALGKKEEIKKENIIYVVTLGDQAKIEAMRASQKLRESLNIKVFLDTREASMKSQMRSADKSSARLVLILGEDEIKSGEVIIRDMKTKDQESFKLENIVEGVKKKLSC